MDWSNCPKCRLKYSADPPDWSKCHVCDKRKEWLVLGGLTFLTGVYPFIMQVTETILLATGISLMGYAIFSFAVCRYWR